MQHCEYLVLSYAPDLLKDEHVNFGLLMLSSEGAAFSAVRFARDLRRVRCLSPHADLEMLRALEEDLRRRLAGVKDREELLQMMQSSFSGTIQVSDVKACLTDSPERELERLAHEQLETKPAPRERNSASRGATAIRRRFRPAFESAGVADLMFWSMTVAPYTYPGDPFKIDCGYRLKQVERSTVKLFHAVSLAGEIESAKALAFTYPRIARGIERHEKAGSRLTAIVEDDLDRASASVSFALEAFAETNIAVAPLAELPALAATARKELGV